MNKIKLKIKLNNNKKINSINTKNENKIKYDLDKNWMPMLY